MKDSPSQSAPTHMKIGLPQPKLASKIGNFAQLMIIRFGHLILMLWETTVISYCNSSEDIS